MLSFKKDSRWKSMRAGAHSWNVSFWPAERETINGVECMTSLFSLWVYWGWLDFVPTNPNIQWTKWGIRIQALRLKHESIFTVQQKNKIPELYDVSGNRLWKPETGWKEL